MKLCNLIDVHKSDFLQLSWEAVKILLGDASFNIHLHSANEDAATYMLTASDVHLMKL